MAVFLRDSIVDAVASGELPEQRLIEASQRVSALATTGAQGRAARTAGGDAPGHTDGTPIGLLAARRALRVTGTARLTGPAHVVEFSTGISLAIDSRTPWGMADALVALRPDTTVARLSENTTLDEVLAGTRGRTPVLVCRDPHRYPWLMGLLKKTVAARPDAIVVEMGVPAGEPIGATHLATHGAAPVCGRAAAEYLIGG